MIDVATSCGGTVRYGPCEADWDGVSVSGLFGEYTEPDGIRGLKSPVGIDVCEKSSADESEVKDSSSSDWTSPMAEEELESESEDGRYSRFSGEDDLRFALDTGVLCILGPLILEGEECFGVLGFEYSGLSEVCS